MRHIGGELPLPESENRAFFLHSGRAGIRTFCRNFPDKKILLPDFLCYIIVDLLEEEGAAYDFYHVDENLVIDLDSVRAKRFDALFVIDYYGKRHRNLTQLDLEDFILFQDSVFDLHLHNYLNAPKWFGFNSLRKVTHLADGAYVKTNLPVEELCLPRPGDFSDLKYAAKALKHRYFDEGTGSEEAYLEALAAGEKALDAEPDICRMSPRSTYEMLELMRNYETELRRRRENFALLERYLGAYRIPYEPEFPSFFVLRVPQKRDALRRFLFGKKVFLPVHWPHFGVDNPLFDQVISIPVFAHYTPEEMEHVAQSVLEFFGKEGQGG